MRFWSLGLVLVLAGSVVAFPTGLCSAQSSSLAETARQEYQAGIRSYRAQEWQQAASHFRAAYALDGDPDHLFNVARSYERAREVAAALRYYRDYLRAKPAASDRRAVEATMHGLEARLSARGLQQVTVVSRPSGVRVLIDGRFRGTTPLTMELPPGSHLLRVEAQGYLGHQQTFVLRSDVSLQLDVALQPTPGRAAPREPTS